MYKNNEWVYAMTKTGQTGYVPYSYVRPSRKYAGYQSEPEYMDTDVYQSGYETDLPVSSTRRYGGARTQIADTSSPPFNVRTGFRGSPENQQYNYQQQQQQQQQLVSPQQQHRHHSRLGSGGSSGGGYSPPSSAVAKNPPAHHFAASGYTSAVEYPTSDARRHPRSAKSLHNILDASGAPLRQDRRPTEEKPKVDSFPRELLEELVVIHDFEANEEDEAFVSKGERVKVLNADDPFWLWVETTPGVQGFVPRSCCSLGNHPCKSYSIIYFMHLCRIACNMMIVIHSRNLCSPGTIIRAFFCSVWLTRYTCPMSTAYMILNLWFIFPPPPPPPPQVIGLLDHVLARYNEKYSPMNLNGNIHSLVWLWD